MEKKHGLKQVLSPRAFQSKEQQQIPRQDARKASLKNDIRRSLKGCVSYAAFEHKMKSLGYEVRKGRGISFIDEKKVKVKGSEVGFSLMKVEKILEANNQKKANKLTPKSMEEQWKEMRDSSGRTSSKTVEKNVNKSQDHSMENNHQEAGNNLLFELMKPEKQAELIHPFPLEKKRKRKKQLRHNL